MEQVRILNEKEISMKLNRIAYQIVENHIENKNIVIAGIANNGIVIAQALKQYIEKILTISIDLIVVKIDKKKPTICTLDDGFVLKNKHIILVDDVTSSGRTMTYALKPFLNDVCASIQTAVLVDRKHKQFPITPDYVGLQLSTTLQEKITVVCENEKAVGAFLD